MSAPARRRVASHVKIVRGMPVSGTANKGVHMSSPTALDSTDRARSDHGSLDHDVAVVGVVVGAGMAGLDLLHRLQPDVAMLLQAMAEALQGFLIGST